MAIKTEIGTGVGGGLRGAADTVAACVEHVGVQLRTQLADMYSFAAPTHKPCDAQAAHDGFRSTHPVTAAGAGIGRELILDKTVAGKPDVEAVREGVTTAAAIATVLGDAVLATAIGTGVGGGLRGAAVAACVEHVGVQPSTQLADMYSFAAPAHKPCDAQAAHDGFRSTHAVAATELASTNIDAGDAWRRAGPHGVAVHCIDRVCVPKPHVAEHWPHGPALQE